MLALKSGFDYLDSNRAVNDFFKQGMKFLNSVSLFGKSFKNGQRVKVIPKPESLNIYEIIFVSPEPYAALRVVQDKENDNFVSAGLQAVGYGMYGL
jgi:hypothetical protein